MSDSVLGWAAGFATPHPVALAEPFGGGHVNKTFLVTDEAGGRYILQSVNAKAFSNPSDVMDNIVKVTTLIGRQVSDPRRRLTLVPTRDGGWWLGGPVGQCWRMYQYVDNTTELTPPVTEAEFAAVGKAFGEFLVQVSAIPGDQLHVTIEAFHDEPRYVAKLKRAVAADPVGRVHEMGAEIERALAFETISHDFDGTAMPLRVTHNDAKVSNVLFDANTREPLCVVDLDTVQPGYAVNDFGDAIRSGATSVSENEPDFGLVRFLPELFVAFTRGYLGACGAVLDESELASLARGARLMTLETTLRFLTDYIEGDVYYKISYETQNRDRARNQLALLEDMQQQWSLMNQLVEESVSRLLDSIG